MAIFKEHKRLEWWMTIQLVEDGPERGIHVADDGWQIRFRNEDGGTVFTIATVAMNNRQPDRGSAMAIIRAECGWWATRQELFTQTLSDALNAND